MYHLKEGFPVTDEILREYLEEDDINMFDYLRDVLKKLFPDFEEKSKSWSQKEYWENVNKLTNLDMEEIMIEFYDFYDDDLICGYDKCPSCRYESLKRIIKENMKGNKRSINLN